MTKLTREIAERRYDLWARLYFKHGGMGNIRNANVCMRHITALARDYNVVRMSQRNAMPSDELAAFKARAEKSILKNQRWKATASEVKRMIIAEYRDFRYVDLRGENLSGVDLSGVDFRKADLRKASFRKSLIIETDFREADLREANFYSAELFYSDLTRADMRHACMIGGDARWANFTDADLRGADLSYADLRGADLSYADLRATTTHNTDITGAKLEKTRLDDNFMGIRDEGDTE